MGSPVRVVVRESGREPVASIGSLEGRETDTLAELSIHKAGDRIVLRLPDGCKITFAGPAAAALSRRGRPGGGQNEGQGT